MQDNKLGIILGNTGTPASPKPDDVEAYLRKFLMDPYIRPLPKFFWKYLLNNKILPKRKYASGAKYEEIWTPQGSPLVIYQGNLATKLEKAIHTLAENGKAPSGVLVRSAMSYSEPSFDTVLKEFKEKGISEIILIPLYPQSNFSSTMAVVDMFHQTLEPMQWNPNVQIIDHYYQHHEYVDAIVSSIRHAGFDPSSNDRLMMTFHSIPLKDIKHGDTYPEQTDQTHIAVAEKLGMKPEEIGYGYQSVFGGHPEQWLGPLTRDILASWADQQFGRVFFILPGFSIDCLETIYDVNHDFTSVLQQGESKHEVTRIPCLNDSDDHVKIMLAALKSYFD